MNVFSPQYIITVTPDPKAVASERKQNLLYIISNVANVALSSLVIVSSLYLVYCAFYYPCFIIENSVLYYELIKIVACVVHYFFNARSPSDSLYPPYAQIGVKAPGDIILADSNRVTIQFPQEGSEMHLGTQLFDLPEKLLVKILSHLACYEKGEQAVAQFSKTCRTGYHLVNSHKERIWRTFLRMQFHLSPLAGQNVSQMYFFLKTEGCAHKLLEGKISTLTIPEGELPFYPYYIASGEEKGSFYHKIWDFKQHVYKAKLHLHSSLTNVYKNSLRVVFLGENLLALHMRRKNRGEGEIFTINLATGERHCEQLDHKWVLHYVTSQRVFVFATISSIDSKIMLMQRNQEWNKCILEGAEGLITFMANSLDETSLLSVERFAPNDFAVRYWNLLNPELHALPTLLVERLRTSPLAAALHVREEQVTAFLGFKGKVTLFQRRGNQLETRDFLLSQQDVEANHLAVTADGEFLIVADSRRHLSFWKIQNTVCLGMIACDREITGLKINPQDDALYVSFKCAICRRRGDKKHGHMEKTHIIDLPALLSTLDPPCISYSYDGVTFAGYSGKISTPRQTFPLPQEVKPRHLLATDITDRGKHLIAAGDNHQLYIYEIDSGRLQKQICYNKSISSLHMAGKDSLFVSFGAEDYLTLDLLSLLPPI